MNPDDPKSVRHLIDALCDRFESELKTGNCGDIRQFLEEVPTSSRSVLFRELVVLWLDYARKDGPGLNLDQLRIDFPEFASDLDDLRLQERATDSKGSSWQDVTLAPGPNPVEKPTSVPATNRIKYFGDYELVEEIARGGMGVVYRARQTSLNRPVALKMILAGQLAGSQEVSRFYSEAEAAANLVHPNIVPIYEVGQHESEHYFSMGLIEGHSLSEVQREGPMDPRKAVTLISTVARAIDYAHKKGVIHRDLKPSNILVDADDQPHITDFGLAKKMESGSELTTTGQVLGTPSYMPPEQARGELDAIGPASDIYSLGAILYALLSGRPPHSADSVVETLRQVVEVEPASVRTLNPAIPRDLETICERCLQKDSAKRFSSGNELADELDRYLRGEPIVSRPVSRAERMVRWCKRHPGLGALSAAVMLLTATLAVGGPLAALKQSQLRQTAEDNEQRANDMASRETLARKKEQQANQQLSLEKENSERALHARTISLAYGEWLNGKLAVCQRMLGSIPIDKRNIEWSYVDSLCNQHLQQFVGPKSYPFKVAFAADNETVIAFGSNSNQGRDPTVYLWKIGSDQPAENREVLGRAITRDGSKMAVFQKQTPSRFQIVETMTGKLICECQGHLPTTNFLSFGGPGDSRIVSVGTDKSVRIWNTQSGKLINTIKTPDRRRLFHAALSPDGNTVAWRRMDDGVAEIRNANTGDLIYEGHQTSVRRSSDLTCEFSPDGSVLAVAGYERVDLLNPKTGESIGRLRGMPGSVLAIAFSPDGKRLAVTAREGKVRIYDVDRQLEITSLTGHGAGVIYGITAVAFDSTGNRILTGGADTFTKLWDAWSGDQESIKAARLDPIELPLPSQQVDYLTGGEGTIECIKISDDGSEIITACSDRSVRLMSLDSGRLIKEWKDLPENLSSVDIDRQSGIVVAGGGGINDVRSGKVYAWNLGTGNKVWESDYADGPIRRVAFMHGGKTIAVCTGSENLTTGQLFALNASTGQLVWTLGDAFGSCRDLAVSPDGTWFATVSDALMTSQNEGVQLWDAETGELKKSIGSHRFHSVAISSDAKHIVAGGRDWGVRVFDADLGEEVWSAIRHTGAVWGVTFTSADSRVLSTSIDGTTRVWDAEHGDLLLTLGDTNDAKFTISASASGDLFAVAGSNPNIMVRRASRAKQNLNRSDIANVSSAPPSNETDAWSVFFEDAFEREEIIDDTKPWKTQGGEWNIENGVLTAKLKPNKWTPGGNAAIIQLGRVVSDEADISCDVTIEAPMTFELKLSDQLGQNYTGGLFIGVKTPFNNGEKGGTIYLTVDGRFGVMATKDRDFEFEVGRKYRLRVKRYENKLEMFVDGRLYQSAEISIGAPMPTINLQAMLGATDSVVRIDNVKVLVPSSAQSRIAATEIVLKAFEEHKIKPLVMAAIDRLEPPPNNDVLKRAHELVEKWPLDEQKTLEQLYKFASDNSLPEQSFSAAYDWIIDKVKNKTQQVHRTASIVALRAGRLRDAMSETVKAADFHSRRHGHPHPVDLAVETIVLNEHGKTEQAIELARILEQVILADHATKDAVAVKWHADVRDQIKAPEIAATDQELMDLVWNNQNALMIDKNAKPYQQVLSDSATMITQRGEEDNYRLTSSAGDWLESEQLWALSGPMGNRLTRTACKLDVDEKEKIVKSDFTFGLPSGHVAWRQWDHFTFDDSNEPKLQKQVVQLLRIQNQGREFNFAADGWEKLDEGVAQAKAADNPLGHVASLSRANRYKEAVDVAKKMIESPDATARSYGFLAEVAYYAKQPALMKEAATKAVELDPMVGGPPFIRAWAVLSTLDKEQQKMFNDTISVRASKVVKKAPLELLAAGPSGHGAWQATRDSLIGLIVSPKNPNDTSTLDEMVDKSVDTRNGIFGADVVDRRKLQFGEHPARAVTFRGTGIGRAMMPIGQGKPVLQQFIFIDSSRAVFVILFSSYQSEWDQRLPEFHQFLRTLKIDD